MAGQRDDCAALMALPRALRWTPLLLALVYLLPLGVRPLLAPDEVRYAEISREMIVSGDWIVPHFLGLRYFEKPVLGYWLNALGELAFGHSNFAVRLPGTLCTLASAFLVAMLAARVRGERRDATVGATVYLSCLLVFVIGTTSVLDSQLALWMTAAMVAYDSALRAASARGRLWRHVCFGLCCGLGFLTKGGVALAVPFVAIVPFMLWEQRWRELLGFGFVAVAAAIAGREPDFWHYFFWEEHIRRFAGSEPQHPQPWWFFVPVLLLGAMPWTFTALPAWRTLRRRVDRASLRYLSCWLLFPLLFFSIARGKLATYVLPSFAPLAVLLALALAAHGPDDEAQPWRLATAANVLCAGILGAAVLATSGWFEHGRVFAPDEWPQVLALVLALAAWLLGAWRARGKPVTLRIRDYAWMLLPFLLALPFVHPASGAWGRAQAPFIAAQAGLLDEHTVILSNDVSFAGALGWHLERSDISLYETEGELTYGLRYPDGAGRRVAAADFADWLERTRKGRSVALFESGGESAALPPADVVARAPGYALHFYRARP
jgi:4-amino-4-deoxy-L-arabinose transferase